MVSKFFGYLCCQKNWKIKNNYLSKLREWWQDLLQIHDSIQNYARSMQHCTDEQNKPINSKSIPSHLPSLLHLSSVRIPIARACSTGNPQAGREGRSVQKQRLPHLSINLTSTPVCTISSSLVVDHGVNNHSVVKIRMFCHPKKKFSTFSHLI